MTAKLRLITGLAVLICGGLALWKFVPRSTSPAAVPSVPGRAVAGAYKSRPGIDSAGFWLLTSVVPPWSPDASLEEIRDTWSNAAPRAIAALEQQLEQPGLPLRQRFALMHKKTLLLNSQGKTQDALAMLEQTRAIAESDAEIGREALYSIIYLQGVTSLRRGENDNCILCRGESSCILPISPAARHTRPEGSRAAIGYFLEYLEQFPDDAEIRWLLNVAHMTLGEHPGGVDPRFLIPLERFENSEFDIGRFRDVGHIVGVNQFSQSGGAILEDFDQDGLLDVVVTDYDPSGQMNFLRGSRAGVFVDSTNPSGLKGQLGGLNCVQTDYNNDGWPDLWIVRGAWMRHPMPPTLLRNDGTGTFTDVTDEAGLRLPGNTIASQWADFDNDGDLDVFVCCERQPSRLYRNEGDGHFVDVLRRSGIRAHDGLCKGVAWLDYDNDGFQDLFLNYLTPDPRAQLFHNEQGSGFREAGPELGIDGPAMGFSCWAWDYNNDGWQDIFATSFDTGLGEVVNGLTGKPHTRQTSRLFRNREGRGFDNVTREAGLDDVYAAMGSNFADFDNDGLLDLYLGTGAPDLAMLIPNRMFRNVDGQRFADITASSGTGNLQKGHAVACGDWDRDGNVDLFVEMGGAIPGDQYHNILFQNPGHDQAWITLRLTGTRSNRAAIGARLTVVTEGPAGRTLHRHVSSGSSFGANALEQTIGLGQTTRIRSLRVEWPAGAIQEFTDLAVNQIVRLQEGEARTVPCPRERLPSPLQTSSTPATAD